MQVTFSVAPPLQCNRLTPSIPPPLWFKTSCVCFEVAVIAKAFPWGNSVSRSVERQQQQTREKKTRRWFEEELHKITKQRSEDESPGLWSSIIPRVHFTHTGPTATLWKKLEAAAQSDNTREVNGLCLVDGFERAEWAVNGGVEGRERQTSAPIWERQVPLRFDMNIYRVAKVSERKKFPIATTFRRKSDAGEREKKQFGGISLLRCF